MYKVTVDKDACISCEQCVDACPVGVFEMKDDKAVPVNADECTGCEECKSNCPVECIEVEEV